MCAGGRIVLANMLSLIVQRESQMSDYPKARALQLVMSPVNLHVVSQPSPQFSRGGVFNFQPLWRSTYGIFIFAGGSLFQSCKPIKFDVSSDELIFLEVFAWGAQIFQRL